MRIVSGKASYETMSSVAEKLMEISEMEGTIYRILTLSNKTYLASRLGYSRLGSTRRSRTGLQYKGAGQHIRHDRQFQGAGLDGEQDRQAQEIQGDESHGVQQELQEKEGMRGRMLPCERCGRMVAVRSNLCARLAGRGSSRQGRGRRYGRWPSRKGKSLAVFFGAHVARLSMTRRSATGAYIPCPG